MRNFIVHPSRFSGDIHIPSSKSHTVRAILFAALAKGTSHIQHFLHSPDTNAIIKAVSQLGAEVKRNHTYLEIHGFAGKPKPPNDVIDCGNSGQVLRFIGALAGLLPSYTILTGDHSIRNNRPILPLLEGLNQLGAFGVSSLNNGYAPLIVKGPLTHTTATVDGEDSQPISGLLIAGAFANHPIELHVTNPGEKSWIALTLDWFKRLGISYQCLDFTDYRLEGNSQVNSFSYIVPGDFSTAAYPIAAALITQSQLTLHNIDMNDCQGDKALIPLLQKMGASIDLDEKNKTLTVYPGEKLQGTKVDINDFIDALPILAVIGCFSKGCTEIVNAAIARKKESDRIHSMAKELRKMGAQITEKPDGLMIEGSELHGADLNTYQDHRIAMALTVAALAAKTPSQIIDVDCISKTHPSFDEDFKAIGAKIDL